MSASSSDHGVSGNMTPELAFASGICGAILKGGGIALPVVDDDGNYTGAMRVMFPSTVTMQDEPHWLLVTVSEEEEE